MKKGALLILGLAITALMFLQIGSVQAWVYCQGVGGWVCGADYYHCYDAPDASNYWSGFIPCIIPCGCNCNTAPDPSICTNMGCSWTTTYASCCAYLNQGCNEWCCSNMGYPGCHIATWPTGGYCSGGTSDPGSSGGCTSTGCAAASTITCGQSYTDNCGTSCVTTGTANATNCICINGACVPTTLINKTYWADLQGANIATADTGDTVLMMVPGMGLQIQNVTYNLSKWNPTTWWNPFTWFKKETSSTETTVASITWVTNELGVFYFTAKIGDYAQNQSTNLTVYDPTPSGGSGGGSGGSANGAPVAVIIAPADGYLSSVNYSVTFTQASYDVDDLLNITWNFGDSTKKNFENYFKYSTPTLADTIHNYSAEGTYVITLTAKEMFRSQDNSATRSIRILQEGISVVPVVTSPTDNSNWDSIIVPFNVSSSFVVNCSKSRISNPDRIIGDLNCTYVHAPNTKTTSGYNLTMTWTIVKSGSPTEIVSGDWASNYSDVIDFIKVFSTIGQRTIYPSITYTPI